MRSYQNSNKIKAGKRNLEGKKDKLRPELLFCKLECIGSIMRRELFSLESSDGIEELSID